LFVELLKVDTLFLITRMIMSFFPTVLLIGQY